MHILFQTLLKYFKNTLGSKLNNISPKKKKKVILNEGYIAFLEDNLADSYCELCKLFLHLFFKLAKV